MNNDLKLLLRLHEIYEAKLALVSDVCDCSVPRKGYEHEYIETKAVLEMLGRIIAEKE